MVLPQFLLPIPAAQVGAQSVSARKENQMMGKKIGNCGNVIAEIRGKKDFVAMPLPKMGGKK